MCKIIIFIILLLFPYYISPSDTNYETLKVYNKWYKVENILQEISKKEYSENYNCVDFSKEAIKELEKNNIQAVEIVGKVNNQDHSWIAIEIEPQSNTILQPKDNYNEKLLGTELNAYNELVKKYNILVEQLSRCYSCNCP